MVKEFSLLDTSLRSREDSKDALLAHSGEMRMTLLVNLTIETFVGTLSIAEINCKAFKRILKES